MVNLIQDHSWIQQPYIYSKSDRLLPHVSQVCITSEPQTARHLSKNLWTIFANPGITHDTRITSTTLRRTALSNVNRTRVCFNRI